MKKYTIFLSILIIAISCNQNKDNMTSDLRKNPLLEEWKTQFGTPPFDKIKSIDYLPAIERGIVEHNNEITSIINSKESPSFNNTIVALEKSGKTLKKVSFVFDAVESANTDDVLKETSKKTRPRIKMKSWGLGINHRKSV